MAISRRPAKYGGKQSKKAVKQGGKHRDDSRKGFVLTVADGVNQGREYFFEARAAIGRVEDNDIVIVEPGISRNHACVIHEHGIFLLEDLGSANGTRLNGERLTANEREVLRDGDYISLAQTTLQFSVLASLRGEITAETRLADLEKQASDFTAEGGGVPKRSFLRSRRGKVLVGLGVLLALLGLGWTFLRKKAIGVASDQSDVPLTYSDQDAFFNSVFGNGKWDQTHTNAAIIHFEYLGGRVTLQYGAWGIDKVKEVELLLNGKVVGHVPLTMKRWIYGLKLVLPRDKLRKGKNVITFNNARNPPNTDTWEVCYVQIIQEAIPPANVKEARLRFELAKKAWEDRDIEPSNMSDALIDFKKARDYLESLPEKPDLYQEALDMIDKVDKELTRRFQEGLFTARRAEKLDADRKKARLTLLRTLRYFRKDDFRHRELKRNLDRLAE